MSELSGIRVALVAARWNDAFVLPLIRGATEALTALGIPERDIDVIRVPGSFEIPQAALYAAQSGRYDAIVGLGVLNGKQALARCGGVLGNRGADAALAAGEMVLIRRKLLVSSPESHSEDGRARSHK